MAVYRSGILSWCLCIMGTLLFSCNSSKIGSRTDPQEKDEEAGPRICFLTYQLKRDSTRSAYTAELINMIMKDGRLKDAGNHATQARKDDLRLLIMDVNQQPMTTQYIPNPLDKSVEYVNDSRQLERKMIHLDSARFNARMQIEPGAGSILLYRIIGDNNEENLILKTPIQ